jgi:hypothetical protein
LYNNHNNNNNRKNNYLTNFIKLNRKVYWPSVRILRSGKAKYSPCLPCGFFNRLGELTNEPISTRVHLGGLEMMLRSSCRSADQRVTCKTKNGVCKDLSYDESTIITRTLNLSLAFSPPFFSILQRLVLYIYCKSTQASFPSCFTINCTIGGGSMGRLSFSPKPHMRA